MRYQYAYCTVLAISVVQAAVPVLASIGTTARPIVAQSVPSISPLAVVAIYGLADPSVLCAANSAFVATQYPAGTEAPPIPSSAQAPVDADPSTDPSCVLPMTDQMAAPTTPPAESEIAPLLALGPLLAAAAVAGTAAAIASGNDDGNSPVSPS